MDQRKIIHLDRDRLDWFIQQQVRLGKEAEKDWEFFNQSTEEYLREFYSRMETDPRTRLYWVEENIKGFITSKIVTSISSTELFLKNLEVPFGMMSPPIVRPREKKIEISLIEEAVDILENLEAKAIICNVSPSWNILQYLEERNFKPVDSLLRRAIINVSVLPNGLRFERTTCPDNCRSEKIRLLAKNLGYSSEFASQVLTDLPSFVKEYRDFCIHDGRRLKAWARVNCRESRWSMGPIYTEGVDVESSQKILRQIREFLEQKNVTEMTILCGKQGEHLLKNFGKEILFKPAIQTYLKIVRN